MIPVDGRRANSMSEVRRGAPSSPPGSSSTLTAHHHTSPQLLKQLTSPPVVSAANFAAMVTAAANTGSSPGGGGSHTPYVLTPSVSGRSSPSMSPCPARKKLKLDVEAANVERDHGSRRKRLSDRRQARLQSVASAYKDNMSEWFFLQSEGGNIVDLHSFRRKPSQHFLTFLTSHSAPTRVIDDVRARVLGPAMLTPVPVVLPTPPPLPRSVTSAAMAAALMAKAAESGIPLVASQRLPNLLPPYSPRAALMSPVRVGDQLQTFSGPSTSDAAEPNRASVFREQLVEKVKQEAWVVRRVNELTREGLWSEKRLPKVCERPKGRTQWDVLLNEMRWLAVDFYQERQWKKAAAKMLAESAKAYVESLEERRAKVREAKERKLRKVAGFVSEQVLSFWNEAAAEALVSSVDSISLSNHVSAETHSEENPSVSSSALVKPNCERPIMLDSEQPDSNSDLKSFCVTNNDNDSKSRLTDLSYKRHRIMNHLKTNLSNEIELLVDDNDKDFSCDALESDDDDESTIADQVTDKLKKENSRNIVICVLSDVFIWLCFDKLLH